MKKLWFLFFVILISGLSLPFTDSKAAEYPEIVATQLTIEQNLEERVQAVLNRMLGHNGAKVVVTVEPNVERSMTEIETWAEQKSKEEEDKEKSREKKPAKPPEVKELLPGIPLKKSVLEKEEEAAQPPVQEAKKEAMGVRKKVESIVKVPPSFIKRIVATVLIDKKFPDSVVETVESVVNDILNLDPRRGDKLIIKRVSFASLAPWWNLFLKPQTYLVIIGLLVAIAFTMFLFGFGPFKALLENILATVKELKAYKVEAEAGTTAKTGETGISTQVAVGEGGVSPTGILTEVTEKKRGTFDFIKDTNVKKLLYLLKNEPPQTMALVLSYLAPDQSAKILSSLTPELQLQVALNLTAVKEMDERIISRIEKRLKEKINLLKGGIDDFLEVFNRLDEHTRNNILAGLEKTNPKLAQKLRNLTFTFDQIATLDNATLRIILGEINTSELAVALRKASEDLKSKIMENMSSGGAVLLKEEMEFGKPVTSQAIEQEQQKIVDLILKMEREGKIELKGRRMEEFERIDEIEDIKRIIEDEVIRKKFAEEPEESGYLAHEFGEAEETNNEKAFEYYNAGIEASQAGRYDEAIEHFKKSLQYNDKIWQTYQYLGTCYYNQGREEEAIRAYRKALELNPENRELSEWLKGRGEINPL